VRWRSPENLPEYAPSTINERRFSDVGRSPRWFPHSRFKHDSHRLLNCTACHADAPNSRLTSDVLLPTIESCRECHKPTGGARTDCAECHTYHPAGDKRHFRGSLTIEEALRGPSAVHPKPPAPLQSKD
jgi:hypothetical protein